MVVPAAQGMVVFNGCIVYRTNFSNYLFVTVRVILKTVPKNLTLVKLDERVRRPSQRSNVLLKIIRIIYLTFMCVTCVNHVTHSSNVLDQILVRRLWRCKNIWA